MTAHRIVTYLQHLDGGGVERALLRLADGWAAAGRAVTIVAGDASGPLQAEWPEGVARIDIGSRSLLKIARTVQFTPGDLLFCPGNHYSSIAAAARMHRTWKAKPIVVKLSNALERADQSPPVKLAYRAWLRLHPRFADRLIALSPALADEAVRMTGIARERVAVIPNPPARTIAEAVPVTVPSGRFVLGVGRLVPQKRWERLIAAMPDLPDDVALLILGEGAERAALTAQIARLGLSDRVWLPGHAGDPLPAMAAARVVALTSDFEGSPGVLAEALGVGTPVVATDSSVAIRELVGNTGRVVPVGGPQALVAALRWAIDAPRIEPLRNEADAVEAYLRLFDGLVG